MRTAEDKTNAQPDNTGTQCTAYAMRFVLWLLASFSLFDLAPTSADPGRTAKWYAARELSDMADALNRAVAVAAPGDQFELAELSTPAPALDGDDAAAATRLPLPSEAPLAPEPFDLAHFDGQAFSAFHSRAPPADA